MNYFITNKIFQYFFVLKNVNDAFCYTLNTFAFVFVPRETKKFHVKHFCST